MSTSHDDLRRHPGHLIRRAQQVHYWLWNAEVSPEVTSPQFAVLYALRAEKNIDQKTLGERVSLDRSTTAEVAARLKPPGLLHRFRPPPASCPGRASPPSSLSGAAGTMSNAGYGRESSNRDRPISSPRPAWANA